MIKTLIAREFELEQIKESHTSKFPEFVAMIGRRRVGKTYIIDHYFKQKYDFTITAKHTDHPKDHFENFAKKINYYSTTKKSFKKIKNWATAFDQLQEILSIKPNKRKTIFIDELPWFDTPRSGFVEELAHFWNDWASKRNVFLIVSGSAASWMISNLIDNTGGLHNRITKTIFMQPFTIGETKKYLAFRGFNNLDAYELSIIYMTLGGIPFYLNQLRKNWSTLQNIDFLFFNAKSPLKNEFLNLYHSLFRNASFYINIIKAISNKWQGLKRDQILTAIHKKDGGHLSEMLEALVLSGFIIKCQPFDKIKKDTLYRLIDSYSLFYLKFVIKKQFSDLLSTIDSTYWKSWTGYAFENLWFCHQQELKQLLGIPSVRTSFSSFTKKSSKESLGTQIDLLIDRADRAINLCESKFDEAPLDVNNTLMQELRNKKTVFKSHTKTKKQIFTTLLTVYGAKNQTNKTLDQVISLEKLLK